MWIVAAILSAFFAGLTAIFAKCGIKKTDSDIVTALRTVVVLFFAWGIVFLTGSMQNMKNIEPNSLFFLILSGLATGASWLCYFKALSTGDVNKVVPIDKSSTVLVVLTAIAIFHETDHLTMKLAGTSLLAIGIWQMLPKQTPAVPDKSPAPNRSWIIYAVLSAIFAALTSILAKIGVTGINSNLATAIRTGVVLVMAFVLLIVKGKLPQRKNIHRKELLFIVLSGLTTGISWLCYYYAIQNGVVSVVVPIDKLSIVVTISFSCLVLKEKLERRAWAGLFLMVCGTLIMAVWG